ncbi:hypothetical protein [Mycoplasmopsis opalescens]|uniref:hypothetical protein n=1 Tax=Mycoplasmopsis opalescens TaxID=114886 RepID=UPI0004A6EA31|nr:hypothetical protein [Mycoplasmopsis opalescens]
MWNYLIAFAVVFGFFSFLAQVYFLWNLKEKDDYSIEQRNTKIAHYSIIISSFIVSICFTYLILMLSLLLASSPFSKYLYEAQNRGIKIATIMSLVVIQVFPTMILAYVLKFLILRKYHKNFTN